jgi:hypothetical protein
VNFVTGILAQLMEPLVFMSRALSASAMLEQVRRLTAIAATIPAAVHFDSMGIQNCIAALAREFGRWR